MDPKKPSIGIIIPNDFVKRLPFAGGSGFIQNLTKSIDNPLTIFGSGANGTALWKKYQINKNVTFIATYPVNFPSPFPGRLKALLGYIKNRRRILQSNIDVLYVHSPECALPFLFGKKRKPLIFHQHGSGNPMITAKFIWARNRLIIWLFERIHQEIYRRADWIIVIDRICMQQAIRYGAQNKTSLLMNAVDTNRFRPNDVIRSTERASLQISEDAFVVLFVGRLEEIKQVDILVKSIISVKNKLPVRLLLAGGGTKYESLKKLVNKLHLSSAVRFLGKVSHDEIHVYYNIADVLVLPSKMEGAPMVILEALACGTPVVASAVGGIPDLVRTGENGVLLKTVTPETIEYGITAVRHMNFQRNAVSSTISQWSAVRVAGELSSIFQKLL
jgi:glycosyltransferase involved in cell wall biosynthesis